MAKSRALRFTSVESMPPAMQKLVRKQLAPTPAVSLPPTVPNPPPARRTKYGNVTTKVDGIRFDSKREAAFYVSLKARKAAGEVSHWFRQVPIHLPGGTRYVVDFLVFYVDPARPPDHVDVKGRETAMFRVKRREVEHHYPIRIVLA